MNPKIYARGLLGQWWYNFTEVFALVLTHKSLPDTLNADKFKYGRKRKNYVTTYSRKDLEKTKKPLFLYIHGGGWISGLTPMRNPYIMNWAEKGFFTASVSYSYAPQKTFPAQIKEIFKAIDTLLDKADEYGFDPKNVIIAGESAGGYYIHFVASALENPKVLKKLNIRFKHKGDIKIKGLVGHSGAYNLERITDLSKPQSKFFDIQMMISTFLGVPRDKLHDYLTSKNGKYICPKTTKGFPPSFLVFGTNCKLQNETFDMAEELTALGVPNKVYKTSGISGNHGWSIVTMLPGGKACLKETFDFILPLIPYFKKKHGQWVIK